MTAPTKPRSRILLILPTLGQRVELLKQTLESVASQGAYTPDIVIICPGKSVEARQLAKEFGASVADDPGSLSAALNVGIAEAQPWHEYLSWIGDDDLLRPDSLATAAGALDADPKAVAAFGYCDYIDETDQVLLTSRAGRLAPWLMTWGPNLVPLPGALFRLSAVREVGGFDTALKYAMDLDIFLRLQRVGRLHNTQKTLAAFRWHPDSTTVANRTASLAESEAIKRKYLPKPLQLLAPIWEMPIRFATRLAVRRVNSIAHAKRAA